MAGTYTEGISKVLSGVYSLIKAIVATITRGARGKVAYPFTSDWGPTNTLVTVSTANEFKALYNGDKTALTAAKIFLHAFKGNPAKVLTYRMATVAAAKGTCTINDVGAAKSLELETLYPSARALTAVVVDGLSGGKIVKIVEGGIVLMQAEATTQAALIALLNTSSFVRVKTSGANLPNNNAGVAFAGGNNGNIVTATEYAAFLDVFEADHTANAFAYDAVTDTSILATAEAFTKRVRLDGFYVTFVRGGLATWDQTGGVALANTVSKASNSRGVINVGNGVDGYTSAEMAIYVAARVASVALNRTLTDEVAPYTTVNLKLKKADREASKLAGTLIFVMDGDYVVIDEGVNTMTTPGEGESVEFGKIRVNNTMDQITTDLEAFGNAYKRDKSNTPEARELYAAAIEGDYLKPLAAQEVVQTGYFYKPDPDYHGEDPVYPAKVDEAFFYGDITPVDSMERIYQKIGVNF